MKEDKTLENLFDLDGETFVVDETLGLWVKFEIRKIVPNKERPHGVRYSLTLHDRNNDRLLGFDNSHVIEFGGKNQVAPKKSYDHWHRDSSDKGRPYNYVSAGKLIEDFWIEVDKKLEILKNERN